MYYKIINIFPKQFDKLKIKILSYQKKITIYLISKRKTMVNTIAWIINPNIVGQPSLFAIGPTSGDNKR
jgi:phosphopantetheine adenylyltransferase